MGTRIGGAALGICDVFQGVGDKRSRAVMAVAGGCCVVREAEAFMLAAQMRFETVFASTPGPQ